MRFLQKCSFTTCLIYHIDQTLHKQTTNPSSTIFFCVYVVGCSMRHMTTYQFVKNLTGIDRCMTNILSLEYQYRTYNFAKTHTFARILYKI